MENDKYIHVPLKLNNLTGREGSLAPASGFAASRAVSLRLTGQPIKIFARLSLANNREEPRAGEASLTARDAAKPRADRAPFPTSQVRQLERCLFD
jgi:hypothetical protein